MSELAREVEAADWLVASLTEAQAAVIRGFLRGEEEALLDGLAEMLILSYLLAGRLGFGFRRLDLRARERLRANIASRHELERWFGDLSGLLVHLER